MTKRMLIDDTQPEETRVVVVNGNKLEDVEFESSSRKQIKGNVYLAKVMRIEPSLQAAFVDYGGNRHGFLAFGEIHPDYYHVDDKTMAELEKEVDAMIENKKQAIKEREQERARIREEKALKRAQRLEQEAAEARAREEAAKAADENGTDAEAQPAAAAEQPEGSNASSAAAAVASSETAAKGFDFSSFSSPMSALWGTAKQIPSILVGTIVGIVCCCFMTSDYHTLRSLIMTQAGKRADAFIRTKQIIFSTLGKMIRAYGLIMCITFLEMVLGLSILKLFGIYENGYIFAIALITAVIDIVPVLGTGTVLIPWAIWMFFSGDVAMGIGLLVIYGVITVVRQIIEPKLVASQLGLPAFVTLMAMYIGSRLFGFVGLFLLPMTVMLLKVLNDDGVIHIFKVPPEEAAEFKAAKDKDEKTDAERKAKKREGIKKIKTGKKK